MLAGASVAGPLEDARAAYQRGDYAEAVKRYGVVADQGHADAQYWVGVMYDGGKGVPQETSGQGQVLAAHLKPEAPDDFLRVVFWDCAFAKEESRVIDTGHFRASPPSCGH
jgi:TPR repeat protein